MHDQIDDCTVCVAGKWKDEAKQTGVDACIACSAGKYGRPQDNSGENHNSEADCELCTREDAGMTGSAGTATVSSAEGSDDASDCFAETCNAGYHVTSTAGSEQECDDCERGYYCPGGASPRLSCPLTGVPGMTAVTSIANASSVNDCYPSRCDGGYGQYDACTTEWENWCPVGTVGGCCLLCNVSNPTPVSYTHLTLPTIYSV